VVHIPRVSPWAELSNAFGVKRGNAVSIEISVITCAHNPRPDYLKRVVDALNQQTLDMQRWEYLLIDNASDEPLAARVDLSWQPNARHVREEKLGLTPARLRGIEESTGEILVFVDDDNVLDDDYLAQVARISREWPMIGAFSGQVRPCFEEEPPEWTRAYWDRLAIREFDRDSWSNIPCLDHTTPNGAGLCVRRRVASEYLSYHANGQRKIVLDRTGASLISAGDLDLAATACDIGLGNGLFASLKLTHLMPRERLQEDYLLRLMEAQGTSAILLDSFRANGSAPMRRPMRTIIANQIRMLFMGRRERRFFKALRRGHAKAFQFLSGHQ
jgi:glycosyltransferase involved in cell wall biosynthesis